MSSGIVKGKDKADQGKVAKGQVIESTQIRVSVSFKYMDLEHSEFSPAKCETGYPQKLFLRLRDLNQEQWDNLKTARRDDPRRIHPIDWEKVRNHEFQKGFQKLPSQVKAFADDNSWQIGVTRGKHGRIHGFFIEEISTFYAVWVDPDHLLFPSDIQEKNKRGKR